MISEVTARTSPGGVQRCARGTSYRSSARNVQAAVRCARAAVHDPRSHVVFWSQSIGQHHLYVKSYGVEAENLNLANRALCEVTILANLAEKSESRQPLTSFCEVSEVISPLRTYAGAHARTRAGDNAQPNRTGLKITSHNLANLAEQSASRAAADPQRRLEHAVRPRRRHCTTWPQLPKSLTNAARATRWPTARLYKVIARTEATNDKRSRANSIHHSSSNCRRKPGVSH